MSSQLWQQGQRLRDQLLQDMDSWKGQIATCVGCASGARRPSHSLTLPSRLSQAEGPDGGHA